MRRHKKLIFLILQYVEQNVTNGDGVPLPEFNDYTRSEIEYHVRLCEEAGYIDTVVQEKSGPPIGIQRLTWIGHEELDRIRTDGCCEN